MEEKKRIRSKNILLNVDINKNSPRVFKRSFHSTNSLRYCFIVEAMNIIQLEGMQSTITQAIIDLQAQDFAADSVTKAVNFLLSKAKAVDITHADFWGFDIKILQAKGIYSEDALKEFQKMETHMNNNLNNTKYDFVLVRMIRNGDISIQAAELARKTN
jgi:hypothetical protein